MRVTVCRWAKPIRENSELKTIAVVAEFLIYPDRFRNGYLWTLNTPNSRWRWWVRHPQDAEIHELVKNRESCIPVLARVPGTRITLLSSAPPRTNPQHLLTSLVYSLLLQDRHGQYRERSRLVYIFRSLVGLPATGNLWKLSRQA